MSRFSPAIDDRDWQRRLQRDKARHIPIQAGEVAEFARPLGWFIREALSLAAVVTAVVTVIILIIAGAA